VILARRLELAHRQQVRRRLAVLLEWLTAHAIVRWRGQEISPELVTELEASVGDLIAQAADVGGFSYFGIRNRGDLIEVPISLYLTDDPRYRYGTVAIDLPPLLDWIMKGGAVGAGWREPTSLTVDDLT
jgi:hypothetical protein